jgi:two-component system, OmpR family, KDP operon response regulator KdpE
MANILVVEDEQALERVFTLNLVRRGHSVAEAGSVADAEALILAAQPPFDLVLLDINLPDRPGWDLLRDWQLRMRRQGSASPRVIVVTAVRPTPDRIQTFAPDAVLVKPFPIDVLLRLIDRVLNAAQPEVSALTEDFYG